MKPVNQIEVKRNRIKFLAMYSATVLLIVTIMCSFLISKPVEKTVIVQKIKTIKDSIKVDNNATNNLNEIQTSYKKKIEALQVTLNAQHNAVVKLQTELKQKQSIKKPVDNNNAEITKLNKQIEFLNWALRSQVAVTNTLTKENNALKANGVKHN